MRTTTRRLRFHLHFALIALLAALASAWAPIDARAAALPNVLVNDPNADTTARDTQLETSLVLGPRGTLVSAYVDSGSWDGVSGGANDHFIGLSMSLDGGLSWIDQGALPDTIKGDGLNPVLARSLGVGGIADTIYLAVTDFGTNNIQVFSHMDNGMPFLPNLMGFVTTAAGAPGIRVEKPWIAVDNFLDPSPIPPLLPKGQGNLYLAWRSNLNTIWFTKSIDNGNSFLPAVPLTTVGGAAPFNANAPVIVVSSNSAALADHPVFVFWLEQGVPGAPNTIRMRKLPTTTTPAMTFDPVVTVVTMNALNNSRDGDLHLQSGFLGNSFPQAAANPIVPTHLYVAFNDKPAGVANADKADVFLLQSANDGATWTPVGPLGRVNDEPALLPPSAPGTNDNYGPALAIAPDGRSLFVGFYDRRRDPKNILIDTFGRVAAISPAGVASFPPGSGTFRITTNSFPPVTDQDPGFANFTAGSLADYYMGSYDTAISDGSFFYYTWGDNRLSHTFTGGRHLNQPDVRFTRVPVAGAGGIIDLYTEGPGGGVVVSPMGGNGNGSIDFDECNNLLITLINRGDQQVVGISAVLQSLTPGVSVSQRASVYTDLFPGQTNFNGMAYSITTPPDFVCGTIIQLQLTVTTAAAGTFVIPIQLNTGTPGSFVNFPSLNVFPIPIPDAPGAAVDSTVHVTGLTAPITGVKVRLFITHAFDSDLDISLEGPDGTTIVLSSDNGVAAPNYGVSCALPTIFDDNAPSEIIFGTAPFAGAFRPEQLLAAFNGKSGNGNWILHVQDDDPIIVGTINCFSLDISTATCSPGGGSCLAFAGAQVTGGNANGRLDPNECDNLTVTLRNTRPVEFTGVSAVLISLTPGVTVLKADSAYPDLAGSGSLPPASTFGANLMPFKISLSPSVLCGTFVDFVLKVTAQNDGTFNVPFRLQVGSCSSETFAAVDPQVPKLIPDAVGVVPGCVESSITIPVDHFGAPIGKVTVSVGIFHGNVSNLKLTLISPDGTGVVLATNVDSGGDNFGLFTTGVPPFTCLAPTLFDDDSGINIAAGVPPYAGAFVPTGPIVNAPGVCAPISDAFSGPILRPLFAFSGKSGPAVNGTWRLRIEDRTPADVGQLICWSLTICPPEQYRPVPGVLPAGIPDGLPGSYNDIAIPVSGITTAISKVRLSTFITHPNTHDLHLTLISPDDTIVDLTSNNGPGGAMNYGLSAAVPTVFDDDATNSITTANVFLGSYAVGTFRPEAPLAAFGGKSGAAVNGTWILRVSDDTPGPVALQVVSAVRLDLFAAACTAGGGVCPPVFLLSVDAVNSGGSVHITGSDAGGGFVGDTLFARSYDGGSTLTLTAPFTAPNGNTFVVWKIDGVSQTPGALTVSVTMNGPHTVAAVYSGPLTLSVNALNAGAGANITVTPPPGGVTPFTRSYPANTVVTLTADPIALNSFVFLRWIIDGVPQAPGVNPIVVTMTTAHIVTAEYESPFRTLRVESDDPDSGVHIAVADLTHGTTSDGITTFNRDFLTGSQVRLTAPAIAPDGSLFKRWEVDGHDFARGLNPITITMNTYHKAEAEYESANVELKVKSEDPDHGVGITGTDVTGLFGGTTTFTRIVPRYSTVFLLAPPQAGGHLFKRWEIDDDDQPRHLQTVTIFMDEDITAEAEFDEDVVGSTAYALWFDGFDDRVAVPDSASLRITGPITVEALIKREFGGTEQTIVEKSGLPGSAPAVGGYALSVTSGDKLRFQTKDSSAVASTVVGLTSLQPGVWYHVAGVWNGSELRVYVNGVPDGSLASASNPKLGNTALLIGARGTAAGQGVFAGYIDELRIWSVARSQADLTANQSACLTGTEPGLAAYWRFNEDDTMVAHDSTPNLNNGMLFNGPLWVDSLSGCTTVASPSPLILPRAALPPAALQLSASMLTETNGQVSSFMVKGPPGQEVLIEVSADLIHWAPLSCITNVTGAFQLSDPISSNASRRFFRVREEE